MSEQRTAIEPGEEPVTNPGADTAWLSWLRVVAICGVIAIHSVGFNAARPLARETLRGQVALLLDWGAVFAVPVFVMCSGAMMLDPARYRGPGAFLRKRVGRLVPAVVFWHVWYVGLLVLVVGQDLTLRDVVSRSLNGTLYTALYFFWIVLGLSVIAPVLVPYVRDTGQRGAVIGGLVGCAIPVLTLATFRLREASIPFAASAFTWWFPYVGLFLLGYGLRGVILRGPWLWLATLGCGGLAVLNAWQWRNPDAPGWLQTLSPVGHYSLTGIVYVCLVFLVFQGWISPTGPLRLATGPIGVRWGRLLGDATLGVFGLHLTVLYFVQRAGIGGPERWSPRTLDMLFRLLVVTVITWVIVLALRRLPYAKAVL